MRSDGFAYRIDLLKTSLYRRWTRHITRHPDREELRAETTLSHARNVQVAVCVPHAKIETAGRDKALRGVSVCVDDDSGGMDAPRLIRHHHRGRDGLGCSGESDE